MAGSKDDDPFDWEVERVVQELCTSNRSWIPTPRAKLPDPETLAQKLREGEYDGETLLATPEDDLWKDLGITKAKFRVNLRHAIGQFVSRSPKYKTYLASMKDDADSDVEITEAPQQAFTPMSDTSVPATLAPATVQPVETVDNSETPRIDEHPDEPPKKKARRLGVSAMTTTSRPSNVESPFNTGPLPTELDTIQHSLQEVARVLPEAPPEDFDMDLQQFESSLGAYWGSGKLPRPGIIESSISTSTDNDVEFGWGQPRPIGRAKKKYVADKLKAYLRRQKQDAGDKANDILPVFGQSDDEEYGSELEKLIEEEEMEEEAEQDLDFLDTSDRDEILKQMVDACTTHWHEVQLPKERHKAYKMWDDARRHGTRGSTVKAMSEELWKGRARLEKTLAEMKDNQYKTESELRGMSDFLQPDIDKIEHIKWLIGVLNSPHAPERVVRPKVPLQRKPKTKRKDDIDLWSEGELQEEMRDFIVDDDPYEEADPREQPVEPHDNVEHSIANVPLNPSQSFVSATSDDIEMHDLTQIDDSPFRSRNYALIDLVTPTKPKRGPATPRRSGKRTAQSASPAAEKFPLSDPKAIISKGSLYWEQKHDAERLIVTLLGLQHDAKRDDIFHSVLFLQREADSIESFKQEYIDFICNYSKDPSVLAKGSREKHRYDTARLLTRLFAIYLNKHSGTEFSNFQKIDADTHAIGHIQAGMGHLPEFFTLLTTLAPYFGYTQEDEHLSSDGEYASESSGTIPAAESKQEPDGSSQNVRKKERRRQKEQEQRRMQLRQQVQGSLLPSEKSRLIINESKLEGQNLVYIHDHIAGRIKDHQIDGVRFMWDQILSDAKQGCLLAHTMGLGKTMQVVTLLTAIQQAAKSEDPKVSCQIPDDLKESKTLILCPAGLLQNWVEELLMWAPDGVLEPINSVSADLSEDERAERVQEWAEEGGVLVIGYTMFTQIAKRPDLRSLILESPSIVIGDEAHHLKNEKSQRSTIASLFRTNSRIALTGSPLANNVDEYYAMIEWVAPGFLGEKGWFKSEYTSPIADGLYEDSTRAERRIAKIRLAALTKVVEPKMHRKTVATLKDSLPPKTEYIVYLDIRSVQREVYLSHLGAVDASGGNQAPVMWALIRTLGLLLAHPLILERVLKQKLQANGLPDPKKAGSKGGNEDNFALLPHHAASTTLDKLTAQQGYADLKSSFKMLALFKIIEETTKLGENLLVFTQSIPSLDFIENICRQKKLLYKRLDGKTEVNKRQTQVKAFNEGSGQVYLISTTAGGVGLNIYGANRVVIFDFQHSPVHEQQAIGRAYRIGQTKPVVVYWLICDGTFEKTLHNQQVFKNQLASRVVDKKDPLPKATSMRRYFTEPQQVEHQDTAAYLGRDAILDTLLQSDDIREGISSISTTETFEEEDTQKLEADEIRQANELVLHLSRRNNPAEENTVGIPPQPSEQVRQISDLPPAHPIGSVAVSPLALSFPRPATCPATTASTVTPFSGQAAAGSAMPDVRTGSLPPLSHMEYESDVGNYRTMSLPAESLSISATSPVDHGSAVVDLNANLLTQIEPPISVPPGFPVLVEGHQNYPHQPRMAMPGGYGQLQHQYHNANGLTDSNTTRDDLLPRFLARDDPFIESGPRRQQLGAAGAQSLARAAAESSMPPVAMDTAQRRSAQLAAAASERPTAPQNLLPMAIGDIQNRPIYGAAALDGIASRESMKPMGLGSMTSRPVASPGNRHDGMGDFRDELTRQASYPLRQEVPALVERVNKYIKGGGLVRNSTWSKLKALVRGRQDRADAILNGTVPAETLATAGDPKVGLEDLLDGRRSVPQSQDDKRMKDPDHSRRFLQRSMTDDGQRTEANSQKEKDIAIIKKVWAKRQSKPQDGSPKQPKIKAEKAEQRRQTMSPSGQGPSGQGRTISDPFVIDDD